MVGASLRVAVTDRCNLRCAYCMPVDGVKLAPRAELPSLEQLGHLVHWLNRWRPLRRIKITGGEPLVRCGVVELVRYLARLPGAPEISMTTNATLLAGHARELQEAGLARVNISLDTVHALGYEELTRGGRLSSALAGLDAALEVGFAPVKVNAVLRRSSWRRDVPDLLDLAAQRGLQLRFIELMRTGTEQRWCAGETVSADEVMRWLAEHPDCRMAYGHDLGQYGAEPARRGRLVWRGHELEVGWILPRSRPFCTACDRLRLDSNGRLRRCLMDPATLDLRPLAASRDEHRSWQQVASFVAGKAAPESMDHPLPMASLGG